MASLLDSGHLDWMRDMQERAMPGTIVIERATMTRSAMGGFTESWAAMGTVIGRIYPQNQRSFAEGLAGDQIASTGRWFATLPVDTVVIANDRLVTSGRSFEITKVNNSESWQTAVRCECVTFNEERRA